MAKLLGKSEQEYLLEKTRFLKDLKDLPQPKDFKEPENQIGEKAPIANMNIDTIRLAACFSLLFPLWSHG